MCQHIREVLILILEKPAAQYVRQPLAWLAVGTVRRLAEGWQRAVNDAENGITREREATAGSPRVHRQP